MSKTRPVSEAQRKAMRKYDAKRAELRIAIRLDEHEMAALDAARENLTRAAYVLQAVRKSLGIK
jgi:hypothetical protein